MKLSELIKELGDKYLELGDVDVVISDGHGQYAPDTEVEHSLVDNTPYVVLDVR